MSNSYIRDEELSILLTMPNVVVTSHQAFFTREALNKIASDTCLNIKEIFNNLFEPKKVEETKEESYRIPLFESLSDDALLNCFVPVETKKEESLISKLENRPTIDTIDNVTIKLDGENLLNKYNSGEQLDVIEYKILKEYLMSKQGN